MEPTIYCPQSKTVVHIFRPDWKTIHLVDIAQGLSGVNRYSAMFAKSYSVAQHSLYVAALVPRRIRLEALLHDAPEAYLGDVPAPIKKLVKEYQQLEGNMEKAIERAFGFDISEADRKLIKEADIATRHDEMASLCPEHPRQIPGWVPNRHIKVMARSLVRLAFLEIARRLITDRGHKVP